MLQKKWKIRNIFIGLLVNEKGVMALKAGAFHLAFVSIFNTVSKFYRRKLI
jgi:hypothetical protein